MHKISSLIGAHGGSCQTGRVGHGAVYEAKVLTVFGMPGNKHCPDPLRLVDGEGSACFEDED